MNLFVSFSDYFYPSKAKSYFFSLKRANRMRSKQILVFIMLWVFADLATAQRELCRGGSDIPASTPTNQFIVNGDGTVIDRKTGLMWKQCTEGLSGSNCNTGQARHIPWDEALQAAEDSTTAGHIDWRLPTYKELYSLVEHQCYQPAINQTIFPENTRLADDFYDPFYWSSTVEDEFFGRGVDFATGTLSSINRGFAFAYVRLVRSGVTPQPLISYQAFRNKFMPLSKHEKCQNCHEMSRNNETFGRHVREGRFTVSVDLFDDRVCASCHSSATGFADHWRAPTGARGVVTQDTMLISSTNSTDGCALVNRLRDPLHHLTHDELILWAVEQIPEITVDEWLSLIELMRKPNTNTFNCSP